MSKEFTPPATIDEFHERLAEVAGTLPKRLRQCSDYVASHSERIAVSTVSELAAAAGVQPSAFIRFCQILGFSGYSEMQKMFRGNYTQQWPDYSTRLDNLQNEGAGSPEALLFEFTDAGRKSLERLVNSVNPTRMEHAVAALSEAPLIHIVGFRRAFPVAGYLAYAFEKMNIPAVFHDGLGGLDHRNAIRKDDALIAITFAPYSQETIALADFSNSLGVPVVAISDALSDRHLNFEAIVLTVAELDVGAFRSLSATISLAMALAVAVGTRRSVRSV